MSAPEVVGTRYVIEVLWRIDGAVKTDRFTAAGASVTMTRHGKTIVTLVDGVDERGERVLEVHYEEAVRVLRRPLDVS